MAGITTLNEDLDTVETGVDITPSVTAGTRPAQILVDNEIMDVSAGTSSLTVTRATEGTTAATHANTAPVYAVAKVVQRADSILVYYINSGGTEIKSIVISGDTTPVPNPVGSLAGAALTTDANGTMTWSTGSRVVTAEGHITEAGPGTYTVSVPVKAGSRLLEISWYTDTAFSAATSATLKAGHVGTDNAFITAANIKAQGAGTSHAVTGAGWGTGNEGFLTGKGGYYFAADDTIDMIVVTVGAGTTGRMRIFALIATPGTPIEATKT